MSVANILTTDKHLTVLDSISTNVLSANIINVSTLNGGGGGGGGGSNFGPITITDLTNHNPSITFNNGADANLIISYPTGGNFIVEKPLMIKDEIPHIFLYNNQLANQATITYTDLLLGTPTILLGAPVVGNSITSLGDITLYQNNESSAVFTYPIDASGVYFNSDLLVYNSLSIQSGNGGIGASSARFRYDGQNTFLDGSGGLVINAFDGQNATLGFNNVGTSLAFIKYDNTNLICDAGIILGSIDVSNLKAAVDLETAIPFSVLALIDSTTFDNGSFTPIQTGIETFQFNKSPYLDFYKCTFSLSLASLSPLATAVAFYATFINTSRSDEEPGIQFNSGNPLSSLAPFFDSYTPTVSWTDIYNLSGYEMNDECYIQLYIRSQAVGSQSMTDATITVFYQPHLARIPH